jgi:3-phosphoshikimate 1-carboxyvinyltransferase
MKTLTVPGDKSLTHRALLLAALAAGRSSIRHPLAGADTLATARALTRLGCRVPGLDPAGEVVIEGVGLRGLRQPDGVLDCANSGTTARLLLGILAGHELTADLTGDASLRSRPMRRVTAPLRAMGARFVELGVADRLPLRVTGGRLTGIHHASPHASAQVKSAVLLAGLVGGVAVSVEEPAPSRDHTERMLGRLGVAITRTAQPGGGLRIDLEPAPGLDPLDFDVPGDFSSAAFVLARVLLHGREPVRITGVGVNPGRTGLLPVLARMGARVLLHDTEERCGEPVATLTVEPGALQATTVEAGEVPSLIDEIPVLAVLAARAEGTTVIRGAAELRVKESDRIAALTANLVALGAAVEELPDGLVVHGTDRPLRGRVDSRGDHRIAMAFAVLGAAGDAAIAIDDPAVVDVSYPGFWTMLHEVTAQ